MPMPQSHIDWSRYMEGLNGKANTDLSNVTANIGFITESGSNFVKFSNGYLICWGSADSGVEYTLPRPYAGDYTYEIATSGRSPNNTGTVMVRKQTSTSVNIVWSGGYGISIHFITIGQGA